MCGCFHRGRRPGTRPRAGRGDGSDADTCSIVAQHGHGADYVRNIESNPPVRVRGSLSHTGWRAGTARILDDDDPRERARILSRGNR
jgi:hypothetical protein